ncbi:MAG: cation transporter [Kangiellaceae bacterium]|nr:cation transporter [Kangiellaceae bacterium]|tara:strand:+ start:7204 stop:8160 length:957 start_codon:yes stop_codon:yes gene_type:complete
MSDIQDVSLKHSHNFAADSHAHKRKVKHVFWLTTVVMVLEIAAGSWSGSMALLADGWHMGTHSAAFAIAIFAYSYAQKNATNSDFSFGTGKVTYLGGFASAVALAIVALMMIIESIQRLIEPQPIHFNEAIWVAIIGLMVNIASVFLLHSAPDEHAHHHDHSRHHHHQDSGHHLHHHDHNLKAAYFHVLADTLTSILAIVALLAGLYFGWVWMDALMGIIGAVVISRWSYLLISESADVLLDKSASSLVVSEIRGVIGQYGDTVITDLHVWKVAPEHWSLILSMATSKPLAPDEYKHQLVLAIPQLSHISVEVNERAV